MQFSRNLQFIYKFSLFLLKQLLTLFISIAKPVDYTVYNICRTLSATGSKNFDMVCVPCFIVPVLLFLWHRFIQPYVLRFWNPWAVKDADGNVVKTEFPLNCEGGVCVFSRKQKDSVKDGQAATENKEQNDSISCPVSEGRPKAE